MEYIYTFRPGGSFKKKIIAIFRYVVDISALWKALRSFTSLAKFQTMSLKSFWEIFLYFSTLIADNQLSEKLSAWNI